MTKSTPSLPSAATAAKTTKRSASGSALVPNTKKKTVSVPTKQLQHLTLGPAIRSDIFPSNVSRPSSNEALPSLTDSFVSIPQVVNSAILLANLACPSSSTPAPSYVQQEEIRKIKDRAEEIGLLIGDMLTMFASNPIKNSEIIQEIVLLGPVLNREQYHSLIRQLIPEFNRAGILHEDALQALVQLVQDAPPRFLQDNDLVSILLSILDALALSVQHVSFNTVYLTRAGSKVLQVMADLKVQDLNRKDVHGPLLNLLSKLKKRKDDPVVQYWARYALQSLQYVPDDETALHCFLRHFVTLAGGAIQISEVRHADISGLTDGLPAIIEGGRGIFVALKRSLGSSTKKPWYVAIRGAEVLVRKGDLADLNKAICESSCLSDRWYQWGICQLLGEIAVDQAWGSITRRQAFVLLEEMDKFNETSSKHPEVQGWIRTIVEQVRDLPSSLANDDIKAQANDLDQKLKKISDVRPFPGPCVLASRLSSPQSWTLLNGINNTAPLELQLARLRYVRMVEYKRAKPPVYIPLLCKASLLAAGNTPSLVDEQVARFLDSEHGVMLILGDSGAGKTTFNRRLEHELLLRYRPGGAIPLFIDLKTIDVMDRDLIRTHLTGTNLFSEQQIIGLRDKRKFVLICDGYDESRGMPHLHENNSFNTRFHWTAKTIITCRTQYLGQDYERFFEPLASQLNLNEEAVVAPSELMQAVIVPFEFEQVEQYIEQYATLPATHKSFVNQAVWSTQQYMEWLRKISGLMDLAKNPFMLAIILKTLPRIALKKTRITRAELYDEFLEFHFENEHGRLHRRLSADRKGDAGLALLRKIGKRPFVLRGIEFSKRLAHSIFKEQDGLNSIELSDDIYEVTWKNEFFGPDLMKELMLESSPLVCRASLVEESQQLVHDDPQIVKNLYQFSHRSILEYLYSCLIYDPRLKPPWKNLLAGPLSSTASPLITDHPLGQQDLVLKEPSIIHFLAERVQFQLKSDFKEQLLEIIKRSKREATLGHAASNAMTILIRAGVNFNSADLEGIKIPGADLSGGHFDSAKLNDADLMNVNLTQTWLREADLSGASMKGVFFGERPSLYVDALSSCAVSPDGTLLGLKMEDGETHIYDTSDSWERLYAREEHYGSDRLLAISNGGSYMAFGSHIPGTITESLLVVWKRGKSTPNELSEDVLGSVNGAAFSPISDRLVTVSDDKIIRLWDLDSGEATVLGGGRFQATAVAWSSDGHTIILGGQCLDDQSTVERSEVRRWNIVTGEVELVVVIEQSRLQVSSVAVSPNDRYLVVGFSDPMITYAICCDNLHLWDLQTHSSRVRILPGHTRGLMNVEFSGDSQRIVSSSCDSLIRVWESNTGSLIKTWSGHGDLGAFFVHDHEVISCSETGEVAVFELGLTNAQWGGALELGVHRGHTVSVHCVRYSPDGMFLFSSGEDQTVRKWNVETEESSVVAHLETGHETFVCFIGGHQIAVAESVNYEARIQVFNLQTDGAMTLSDATTKIGRIVAYSQRGSWMASGDEKGFIRLWGQPPFEVERSWAGHAHRIECLEFAKDGRRLASSSQDKKLCLWDPVSAQCTNVVEIGYARFCYSPCGTWIAIGGYVSSSLKIWDVQSETFKCDVADRKMFPTDMLWSPCGKWLAVTGMDCTVRLWRIRYRENLDDFEVIHGAFLQESRTVPAGTFAWSPSEPLQFATCFGESVCVWKVVEQADEVNDRIELVWGSFPKRLNTYRTRIANTTGLEEKRRFLLGRGATDDSSPFVDSGAREHNNTVYDMLNWLPLA